jgi:hypothetical protein
MVLKDLGIPENITTAWLSRKKETPIAVIKADILGAFSYRLICDSVNAKSK